MPSSPLAPTSSTRSPYPAPCGSSTRPRPKGTRWIKDNANHPLVIHAKASVQRHYRQAGPKIEAFRLRGLTPAERAWVAWARLREAGIDPIRPLVAWLTIAKAIQDDQQPDFKKEFQRVQAAKLLHRLASGSHKHWEHQRRDGKTFIEAMHRYPHSRGRVLRHLGEQLKRIAWALETLFLADIGTG